MSEQINTGRYIPGYYIPNIRKLVDVIIKTLDVSSLVFIMPLRIKNSNDIVGYVEKYGDKYTHNRDGKYTIFIDTNILKVDELSDLTINLFIHEIWHIKQMEDGRLRSGDSVAVWDGVHYAITAMPYEDRPWEIEARKMESKYLNQVKEQI